MSPGPLRTSALSALVCWCIICGRCDWDFLLRWERKGPIRKAFTLQGIRFPQNHPQLHVSGMPRHKAIPHQHSYDDQNCLTQLADDPVEWNKTTDSLCIHHTCYFFCMILNLLFRVETSQTQTELVVSPSTEPSSLMRTSNTSTPDPEFCPWPMLDPTPTEANSSFVPSRLSGLMASTSYSAEYVPPKRLRRKRWPLCQQTNHHKANPVGTATPARNTRPRSSDPVLTVKS